MGLFPENIVWDTLERAVREAQSSGTFDMTMAKRIELEVYRDWGPQTLYIPAAKDERIAQRNEKIVELFEARLYDVPALAVRFGLSTKQIRRIVDR